MKWILFVGSNVLAFKTKSMVADDNNSVKSFHSKDKNNRVSVQSRGSQFLGDDLRNNNGKSNLMAFAQSEDEEHRRSPQLALEKLIKSAKFTPRVLTPVGELDEWAEENFDICLGSSSSDGGLGAKNNSRRESYMVQNLMMKNDSRRRSVFADGAGRIPGVRSSSRKNSGFAPGG